jgi:hypothetical protein
VIPASNFTAAFPKMGYLGIKRILDLNNVPYNAKTIIQASDLKERLEQLNLKANNCTIVSIDAIKYYPSVHFKLVRKAVHYYSQHLSEQARTTIDQCLTMISFGMSSTLFTFQDQYYEYDGEANPDDRGLTIGGYESAWLADLVGAYILDNTQHLFKETLFHGFYRDDGFAVFDSTCSYSHLTEWRRNFQQEVNALAEGNYLKYSVSIWLDKSRRCTPLYEYDTMVSVVPDASFPYFDMELFWSNEDDSLHFRVHLKPNQQLKYLNRDSTHTAACFKAIPTGVCYRLAKLTTVLPSNENRPLQDIYPLHFQRLKSANLIQSTPTLALSVKSSNDTRTPNFLHTRPTRH